MPISLLAVGLTVIPNVGGILNGILNKKQRETWYEPKVNKPSWRPPNWLFGPVWTGLYTSMGYASYLVYRDSSGPTRKLALSIYAFQLGLNWIWPPLFFQFHKMGLASLDITLLWFSIWATIWSFHPINNTAGYLLIPYLGWVSYATVLQYSVWLRNRGRKIE